MDALQAGMEFDATSTMQASMSPSDFYMFSHLQLHLDGSIFNSNQEVINEFDLFLDSRKPQFFAEGFEKLPKRWQTTVDLNGDCYPQYLCSFRMYLSF
ncbi:hypothetical protein AVEN_78936-1 [Araneus ventricosus]|uniref:Histone-lysine N-methyltransferase SETMAR n=1 Tax=Araneus ventricosus TaxID=182803 RepID=A0A4Y2RW56_ARAVE|nr:hypothetical protein AVEN_15516-1 [Araneus ventricosus]GBN80038.1 hypothetical protein AVEN_78936-1 [Araneus ventricosus]